MHTYYLSNDLTLHSSLLTNVFSLCSTIVLIVNLQVQQLTGVMSVIIISVRHAILLSISTNFFLFILSSICPLPSTLSFAILSLDK
jgi:hypothetical protein